MGRLARESIVAMSQGPAGQRGDGRGCQLLNERSSFFSILHRSPPGATSNSPGRLCTTSTPASSSSGACMYVPTCPERLSCNSCHGVARRHQYGRTRCASFRYRDAGVIVRMRGAHCTDCVLLQAHHTVGPLRARGDSFQARGHRSSHRRDRCVPAPGRSLPARQYR